VTEKHFLLGGTAEIACRACRPNSSASVEKWTPPPCVCQLDNLILQTTFQSSNYFLHPYFSIDKCCLLRIFRLARAAEVLWAPVAFILRHFQLSVQKSSQASKGRWHSHFRTAWLTHLKSHSVVFLPSFWFSDSLHFVCATSGSLPWHLLVFCVLLWIPHSNGYSFTFLRHGLLWNFKMVGL
jgi:hypothetical protein